MLKILALLKVTVVYQVHMHQNKSASFNSLAKICPMVLMSDSFSRTTLLILQEVCYMVVQ